ncbi:MAG: sulfatase [Polyangiaceae bacterium]|nr:sulfatase [Polyangiaceae bacterium]
MHRTQDAVDAAEDLPSLEPSRPPPSAPSVSMWRLLVPRFAASFLGVAAFLTGEAVVVGVLQHAQLIGPWELLVALTYLVPVGSLAALPLTLLGAITVPLLVAGSSRAARGALAVLAGLGAVSVAYGVSTGPHLANPALRAGFVAAVGCAAVAAAWFLSPAVQNLRARRPGAFLVSCVALLVGCSVANAAVLPKLYPAFHLALSALAVLASAWGGVSVSQYLSPRTWVRAAAVVMLLAAVAMPFVIHALQGWDNVRRVYLTHAPSLGRAVQVAAWLAPERAREAVPSRLDPAAAESEQQWLDWKGRDVLIVSVDALRADHVSAYGYARRTTPEMDAIASQGVLFEYAYCAMPHTSYSMTSLLTGKYMRPLLLQGAGQDSDTLAAVLRRYDYRTAAFFPHSLVVVDQERFGWVHERGLDFDYRKVEYAKGPKRLAQFVEYLDQAPTDHPVFAWVHLFEPHEPYESHPEHPFGDRAVDRYDSEIASADAVLGQVVRVMRERRPNTVVILTADHGEAFGEHGAHYHGTTVFDEQTRVPLIISTNGLDARRVSVPVQLIDIFPTLLHAMDIPRRPRVRGNDLGPWLVGKAKGDGFAFSETHEQTLLAQGRWRLVCERNVDACALFDLQADPQQKRDVTVQQPERYAQMRAALREVRLSEPAHVRRASPCLRRLCGVWRATQTPLRMWRLCSRMRTSCCVAALRRSFTT